MKTPMSIKIFFPFMIFAILAGLSNPQSVTGDTDNGGNNLPDTWEYLRGMNELGAGISVPGGDSDLDGLDTLQEYFAGTDPGNSDTDSGGENDGSEILFAQDPLDPSDDEIQSIPWVEVVAGINKNTITFGSRTEYAYFKLYRSLYPGTGYVIIDGNIQPSGFYVDSGLTAGTTYYYRMMAYDNDGHGSRVSPARSATPARAMPWNLFLPAIINGTAE